MGISVVILTFNSEAVIGDTLAAASRVSDDIHIVDSFSTDRTVEMVKQAGVSLCQRSFRDYADQRNWTIANLPLRHGWQLHLDADEILTDELVTEIKALNGQWPSGIDGYFVPRLTRFLGRDLWHGGHYPIYHMRLFRTGFAVVEDRKYDQHFVLTGIGEKLKHPFIDDHRMSLTEWTARHNRWADFAAEDALRDDGLAVAPDIRGNPLEQSRARKTFYYRCPLFLRAFMLFFYRYILRGGFRDGIPGLIFHFLQGFWFRFLVDAKIYEKRLSASESRSGKPE